MSESLQKLGLLLHKNWLIQKRRRKKLLIDILVPVFIGAFLLYVRSASVYDEIDHPTIFSAFSPQHIPEKPQTDSKKLISEFKRKNYSLPKDLRLRNEIFNQVTARSREYANQILADNRTVQDQDRRWTVLWSPYNQNLFKVMDIACKKMNVICSFVKNSATLEKYLTTPIAFTNPKATVLAGIVFPDNITEKQSLPLAMNVRLRFPAERRFPGQQQYNIIPFNWMTGLVFPVFQMPGPRDAYDKGGGSPGYYKEGFLGVQDAISSSLFEYHLKEMTREFTNAEFTINLSRFPYPKYTMDRLIVAMQNFLPFLIVISFLFTVNNMVEKITTEKEKRLKVVMKIMSLSDSLRWSSWYIFSLAFFTLLLLILTLTLKFPFINGRPILQNSDWSCLLVFFILYASAATTFCFLMSTIFSRASVASIVSGMVWFLIFVPYYFIQPRYGEIDGFTKAISGLLVNTGMAIGIQIILMYEGAGAGIQWDNILNTATPDDNISMATILIIMVVDTILYLCIGLYIENVFPGEYGTALPWYYPFQRSYWSGTRKEKNKISEISSAAESDDYVLEEGPSNHPAGIQIHNLRKVYKGSKKDAVTNLNLNVYEGQITVLMGFNGAGKTTTLSILTGILPATSGTAFVGGFDINTDMAEARKSLGFCPQYNVLFDELTVEEHLNFFAKLKGLKKHEVKQETDKYINLLNLNDKRKTLSKYLSGGMKRKLSVALALCGNTKVLLLDEPTSGMDPKARRSLWDLLIAEKKGRSILLTTHFLDEADLLGDRVAIMSEGQLRCHGTTFFLKKHFSCGYHLIMVKKDNCDANKVNDLIEKYIPNDVSNQNAGMELSYQLPEKHSDKFEQLLSAIENEKEELGILSFGISPTTLEDVFMRIAEKETATKNEVEPFTIHEENLAGQNDMKVKIWDNHKVGGKDLFFHQVRAMFLKHILSTVRSWKSYILLIIIAIGGVANAALTLNNQSIQIDLPPRLLDLHNFPDGVVILQRREKCNSKCEEIFNGYMKFIEKESVQIVNLSDSKNMVIHLIEEGEKSLYNYRTHYVLGTEFDVLKEQISIISWFNPEPYHLPPVALSNVYNSLLKTFVNDNASLTFTNEPLPYDEDAKVTIQGPAIGTGFQIAIFTTFSFIFISSAYITFPIQERQSKAKLLQFVAGVNVFIFWFVALIWSMLTSLGPSAAVVATLAAFQEEGFSDSNELAHCILILISFFIAILPMLFFVSLIVSKPTIGFIQMTLVGGVTGIYTTILVMIFQLPILELTDVADILDWVFSLFPLYSMARSLQNVNTASVQYKMCKPIYEEYCLQLKEFKHICCKVPEKCPPSGCLKWTDTIMDWDEPGIGRYLTFLFITGAAFLSILLILDNGLLDFLRYGLNGFKGKANIIDLQLSKTKDSDVLVEADKVSSIGQGSRQNYNLLIDGLSKTFGKYVAVKPIHLTVEGGECFGLLGANGAGKTTTFRMLTGDERPSSGNAFVQGESVKDQLQRVYQRIGYCPQFDALFDDLTGREHLRLYCLLRGVPNSDINEVSTKLANELLFSKFLDKKVGEYSGGTKRKLSTAIALIGNPPVVYLDEPTAGMDPVAKRHLWAVISKVRSQGTTIILTSHSMEECEALCTRLTIMVKGEFKCLGPTQYLKNKFCQGYSLAIKIRKKSPHITGSEDNSGSVVKISTVSYADKIKKFVSENFSGAVPREDHDELLVYVIPPGDITWSKMFGVIESVKDELNIENYSLGQTTLEQILLMFTEMDSPETE